MDKRITELIDQSSTPAQIFNLLFNEDGDRTPDDEIIANHFNNTGKATGLKTTHNRKDLLDNYFPNNDYQTDPFIRKRLKNEYQILLEKEYKRSVEQWYKKLGISSDSGCCFTLTIQPQLHFLKNPMFGNPSNTRKYDAVEKITLALIKGLNQHLFDKLAKDKNKYIRSAYVIESQDKSGRDTNVHCHALLAINPMVARYFTTDLIDKVLKTKDFFWDNHKYKLAETISSYVFDRSITYKDTESAGTDGWIEYILKNAPNPKLTNTADGSWLSNHTFEKHINNNNKC